MKMKVVYVGGPFRAKQRNPYNQWEQENNIRKAEELAWLVWSKGHAAICPHSITRFYQGSLDDEIWLEGDLQILSRCDCLLLVEGWKDSSGTLSEVKFCKDNGIPVFENIDDCINYLNNLNRSEDAL